MGLRWCPAQHFHKRLLSLWMRNNDLEQLDYDLDRLIHGKKYTYLRGFFHHRGPSTVVCLKNKALSM